MMKAERAFGFEGGPGPLSYAVRRGGPRTPDASWLASPREVLLSPRDYAYLIDAYKQKVIPVSVLTRWVDLSFSGIRPTWLWQALAAERDPLVWKDLRSMMSSRPRTLTFGDAVGWVVHDSKGLVRNRWAPEIDSHPMPSAQAMRGLLSREWVVLGEETSSHMFRHWNLWFPSTSMMLAKRARVTPARALMMAVRSGMDLSEAQTIVPACVGLGGQALANLLMACACDNSMTPVVLRMAELGWLSSGLEWYTRVTKEVHTVVRQIQRSWVPVLNLEEGKVDWSHLLYMQNLAGRFNFKELSATEAITDRTTMGRSQQSWTANGWSEDQFRKDCDAYIERVAEDVAWAKKRHDDFDATDLLARYWDIGSSGSAGIMRKRTIRWKGKEMRWNAPTKALWLAHMRARDLRHLLEHRPQLVGSGVDKYEEGKQRLLLPGPIYHWLVESVALFQGDSEVFRKDPDYAMELSAVEELVEYTNRLTATAGDVNVCSDYADFNILHTFDTMRRLWLRIADRVYVGSSQRLGKWKTESFCQFAASAARWAAAALDDVRAKGVVSGAQYQEMVRGLWTGWRSTTFINTTMNKCYGLVAQESFTRIFGYGPVSKMRYLGDDSAGQGRSEWAAMRYLQLLDKMGLEAQSIKQLVGTSSSEFLRLLYIGGEDLRGSMCRAVSGFTSSDAQSPPVRRGPASAQQVSDGAWRLIRRGASPACVRSWQDFLSLELATVPKRVRGKVVKYVTPSLDLLHTSLLDGGLEAVQYGELPLRMQGVQRYEEPDQLWKSFTRQLDLPGVRYAVQKFEERVKAARLSVGSTKSVENLMMSQVVAGSLPLELQKRLNPQMDAAAVAYYEGNRSLQPVPLADSHWVCGIVNHTFDGILRALKQGRGFAATTWSAAVERATSVALGTVAPVPSALSCIHSTSPQFAVAALGGPSVAEDVACVQRQLGPLSRLGWEGKLDTHLPLSGTIAPAHRAVADGCLAAALSSQWWLDHQASADTIREVCYWVGRTLTQRVRASPELLRMMAY
nr:RNA-dependent RNA polymerase [Phytophthora castaneae RNA virus 1]